MGSKAFGMVDETQPGLVLSERGVRKLGVCPRCRASVAQHGRHCESCHGDIGQYVPPGTTLGRSGSVSPERR